MDILKILGTRKVPVNEGTKGVKVLQKVQGTKLMHAQGCMVDGLVNESISLQ